MPMEDAWFLRPGGLLASKRARDPTLGHSTLQVRSLPAWAWELDMGDVPSLTLPRPPSISATCYLDSSSVGQRLGATQA